jgi:UDP-3-O-[3-hydroxymyristoyl] N-acetylglucosamine deacetylase
LLRCGITSKATVWTSDGDPAVRFRKAPVASLSDYQHTLAAPAIIAGVGVHTGQRVRLSIRPAPTDTGIVFVRTDIQDRDNRVPARGDLVVETRMETVIGNAAGVTVATIEHLTASLSALGIDNATVELDGPETPIMDGSAEPFVQLLDRAGRRGQDAPRRFIEILETIEVIEGDKRAALMPADQFELAFEIAFASTAIGRQTIDLVVDETVFRTDLARARTFGFIQEVEALRRIGLARGGSMENVVVIDADRVLNPEGLRWPDEFVRHKALDAVGDLSLLGAPLLGRFEGRFAGHGINNVLLRAVLARPEAWRWRTLTEPYAQAV